MTPLKSGVGVLPLRTASCQFRNLAGHRPGVDERHARKFMHQPTDGLAAAGDCPDSGGPCPVRTYSEPDGSPSDTPGILSTSWLSRRGPREVARLKSATSDTIHTRPHRFHPALARSAALAAAGALSWRLTPADQPRPADEKAVRAPIQTGCTGSPHSATRPGPRTAGHCAGHGR